MIGRRGCEEGRGVVGGALVVGALRRVGSGVQGKVGAGVGVGVGGRGEIRRSWTIVLFGHAVGGQSLGGIEKKR